MLKILKKLYLINNRCSKKFSMNTDRMNVSLSSIRKLSFVIININFQLTRIAVQNKGGKNNCFFWMIIIFHKNNQH